MSQIGSFFGEMTGSAGRLTKNCFYFCDDFLSLAQHASTSAGTGGSNLDNGCEAGAPGVARQNVTAVATPDRNTLCLVGNLLSGMGFGGGFGPWTYEVRTRNIAVEDGVNQRTNRMGLNDIGNVSTDAVDGVYLEEDRAVYGDNNVRICASNNSVRTKVNTGVAATANTWERWGFTVNSEGTSAQAYRNGVAVGAPVTTNIPIGPSRRFGHGLQLVKTLGAGTHTVDRDYVEFFQEFTTPR